MRLQFAFGAAIAFLCAATSSSNAMTLEGPPKPIFLSAGPKDDAGWNQSFEQARARLESRLHMAISSAEVAGDADIRSATEGYIKQGNNIVIGNSGKYFAAFRDLAEKYQHVAFINISDDIADTPQRLNLASVYGRSYEGQYMCGVATGLISKKANIGFVAPNPSAIVNWEINGYALGVRRMKPDATIHVVFTDEADPAKQRAAAAALIDHGADVIGQNVDGPAPQIVAQERGVFATGHALDLHELAPKSALCASVWVWDRFLAPEIEKITAGNWQADPNVLLVGQTRGGVEIACCSSEFTETAMATLLDERDRIIVSGKLVFTGPLTDNHNKQRLPPGSTLGDAELRTMDWYVQGVVIDR